MKAGPVQIELDDEAPVSEKGEAASGGGDFDAQVSTAVDALMDGDAAGAKAALKAAIRACAAEGDY